MKATILDQMADLGWECLQRAPYSQACHRRFFYSHRAWNRFLRASPLRFCSGLGTTISADSPPSLEWFKNLPKPKQDKWAVYALVLVRPQLGPKRTWKMDETVDFAIYIGSGTCQTNGVTTRESDYREKERFSEGVKEMLDSGWTVLHMGMLLWADKPPQWEEEAATMPGGLRINCANFLPRAVFLVLEATMSFALGAMSNRYWSPLWEAEDIPYQGLCKHNALRDPVDPSAAKDFACKIYGMQSSFFDQGIVHDRVAPEPAKPEQMARQGHEQLLRFWAETDP